MDLDLRIPVGLLFVVIGLIMAIFGLTSSPALYEKSFGINVNLYWGIVELIFGSLMIAFGRSRHERESAPAAAAGREADASLRDLPPPRVPPVPPPVPQG